MVEEKIPCAEELQAEDAQAVEPLEESGDRPLKRKKTVTWADGDSLSGYSTVSSDVESGEPGSSSDSGSAPCACSGPEASEWGAQSDKGAAEFGDGDVICTDESLISRRLTVVRDLTAAYEQELRSTLAELERRIEEDEAKAAGATERDEDMDRGSDGSGQGTLGAWWDPSSCDLAPLGKSSPLPPLFETAAEVIRSMARKKGVDGKNNGPSSPRIRPPSPEPLSGTLEAVTTLECRAVGMLARELDSRHGGAVGLLVGRRGRWVLSSSTVVLGRRDSTTPSSSSSIKDSDAGNASPALPDKLPLDVDLSLELGQECARRVSRRQAVLWADMDGEEGTAIFRIRCLGRRAMMVSGKTLLPGASAALTHGSLIQVGGASLMLLPNLVALARLRARADAASA